MKPSEKIRELVKQFRIKDGRSPEDISETYVEIAVMQYLDEEAELIKKPNPCEVMNKCPSCVNK